MTPGPGKSRAPSPFASSCPPTSSPSITTSSPRPASSVIVIGSAMDQMKGSRRLSIWQCSEARDLDINGEEAVRATSVEEEVCTDVKYKQYFGGWLDVNSNG